MYTKLTLLHSCTIFVWRCFYEKLQAEQTAPSKQESLEEEPHNSVKYAKMLSLPLRLNGKHANIHIQENDSSELFVFFY